MLVNRLKRASSRWLRQQHPTNMRKYLWSKHFGLPSYFPASSGAALLTVVSQYIQQPQRPVLRPSAGRKTGSASSRP